jgi:hypothetical protein
MKGNKYLNNGRIINKVIFFFNENLWTIGILVYHVYFFITDLDYIEQQFLILQYNILLDIQSFLIIKDKVNWTVYLYFFSKICFQIFYFIVICIRRPLVELLSFFIILADAFSHFLYYLYNNIWSKCFWFDILSNIWSKIKLIYKFSSSEWNFTFKIFNKIINIYIPYAIIIYLFPNFVVTYIIGMLSEREKTLNHTLDIILYVLIFFIIFVSYFYFYYHGDFITIIILGLFYSIYIILLYYSIK